MSLYQPVQEFTTAIPAYPTGGVPDISGTYVEDPPDLKLAIRIVGALFLPLWCTGAALNVVLLVVFSCHAETRTPENVLLINLCIADLAYLLSGVQYKVASLSKVVEGLCYVSVYCRSFAISLNTYSVAAISVQRYIGIVTFRNRLPADRSDYKRSLLIVAAVWTTSAVLAAVEVVLLAQYIDTSDCTNYVTFGHPVYRLVVYGVIPSIIIAVFYIAAACRVSQSARQLPGEQCEALTALREHRRKSARVLITLVVVFLLTYVPLLITMPLRLSFRAYWVFIGFCISWVLSTLNPVVNPIALCIASRQLRALYRKYCCCCCYQQPTDPEPPNVPQNDTTLNGNTATTDTRV